jgi:hypothetical protein
MKHSTYVLAERIKEIQIQIEEDKNMIRLGEKVKDLVSGFEGIVTAKVEYLNGCIQYCIKPKQGKDGKMPESHYIDEKQLIVIGKGLCVKSKPTGGVMADTPKTEYLG